MAGEIKTDYTQNPIKEKILEDVNQREENAHERMLQKQEQYNAALKKLNIFQEKKYYAERKTKPYFGLVDYSAKCEYNKIAALTSSCEIDASVLRDSLQSSIFYYGKTSLSAYMANSVLG